METIYEFGKPFADKRKPIMILDEAERPIESGFLGIKKSDVWQAFIGFDRPTWIRTLNRRSTFFLTSQVFWQYIPTSTSRFQGQISATDKVRNWEGRRHDCRQHHLYARQAPAGSLLCH